MKVDNLLAQAADLIQRNTKEASVIKDLLSLAFDNYKYQKLKKKISKRTLTLKVNGQDMEVPMVIAVKARADLSVIIVNFSMGLPVISDEYNLQTYPLLDALGCDELIRDGMSHRYKPRNVVTTDGVSIPLPRRIDYTSKVMERDLLELDNLPVPFTTKQVMRTIECVINGEYCAVDDVRLLDFLGCDELIDCISHRVKLSQKDYEVILEMRPCLESRLAGWTLVGKQQWIVGTHVIKITDVSAVTTMTRIRPELLSALKVNRSVFICTNLLSPYVCSLVSGVRYTVPFDKQLFVDVPYDYLAKVVVGLTHYTINICEGVGIEVYPTQEAPAMNHTHLWTVSKDDPCPEGFDKKEFRGTVIDTDGSIWRDYPNAREITVKFMRDLDLRQLTGRRIERKDGWIVVTWMC